ncbi:hypothetical protein Zm00014a_036228 [Zea mays]|uniref:Uncharacterized protein n=1 Tax=Zea mays TaxID=4577 RepID=A0A3L6DYE5_MAIZE|nr:hypothetical protein Zm00014a_036228 [Zea mays]
MFIINPNHKGHTTLCSQGCLSPDADNI